MKEAIDMNEKIKKAKETLLKLSGLALKYLIDNFNYENEEYLKLKQEIGNLTDKLRLTLDDFDRYHESQQDLIKSKDEYIAKLCCDRAELKEHEKELIAEQHRLFDLAKEPEVEHTESTIHFDKKVLESGLSFKEAYMQMVEGKKISRPCFMGWWFMNHESKVVIHDRYDNELKEGDITNTVTNTLANDWEVIE